MKFLYLPYERDVLGQDGMKRSFLKHKEHGLIDDAQFYSFLIKQQELGSWELMLLDLLEFIKVYKPDAILWELHSSGIVNKEFVQQIRSISNPIICQWNGDIRSKPIYEMVEFGRNIDITYISSTGQINDYKERGCRDVRLMPHWCDFQYFENDDWSFNESPKEFDVVMIATLGGYRGYSPFLKGFDGQRDRAKLAKQLSKRYGKRFAVYGRGWDWLKDNNKGISKFTDQFKIIRNSLCSIGTNNFNNVNHYISDRPFISMGSGVPHITRYTPLLEDYFTDGLHTLFFQDYKMAIKLIDKIIDNPSDFHTKIGIPARRLIKEKHQSIHRTRQIISDIIKIQEYNKGIIKYPKPSYDFFL